ncbi:MAG: undecaprenyldiphospho-muramoylpentapeptide beta-N-acetylglucosaminyltransferase [Myxococcota bacterium]
MRFLIAGGGTGGHIFPGIAIAQALKSQNPKSEVLFVGTNRGIEVSAVPKSGFELKTIEISGLKGRSFGKTLQALLQLPLAIIQSVQILTQFKPDAVVGVGGYASGPVLLAAWLLRIPRAICEQNSVPGFTNRMLGKYFVKHVWGVFKKSEMHFPAGRFHLTGNPLRKDFLHRPLAEKSRDKLLVLGGSLGARPLNEVVPAALAQVHQAVPGLKITHQTGVKDVEQVKRAYADLGIDALVLTFIDDMPKAYEESDLVIARAGASTCAELTALGVPAILIPFPQAADDHQTENARELVDAGAALMLTQQEMTALKLGGMVQHLFLDFKTLESMAHKARQIGKKNAAEIIAKKVVEIC